MATMRQAVLVERERLELREVPVPEPGPGELLLDVEVALTCGTDLKTYRRGHPRIPIPTPLGHEVAGTVAAVGAGVTAFREGDALASVPSAPCGACRLCRRGHENLCPDAVGRMVFGAFADQVLLPRHIVDANAFHRPDGMDAATAAALEPLACVVHGADRVALDRAERVVVLGDGPIALLFLQLARLRGAGAVLVAGHHHNRLAVASELGGDPVNTGGAALEEVVADWSGGMGADVVIECVGSPALWQAGAGLVAPGGELLVYGGAGAGTRACFDTERLHYLEVDVKGAFHYGPDAVRRALDLLADGAVSIGPLVTHRVPLARLNEALRLALDREAIKVAVEP